MCVRCGTGKIAWCTDPNRHGDEAWKAASMAKSTKEWRTKVRFRLDPEGDEPTAKTFKLLLSTEQQFREGRQTRWATDYAHPDNVVGKVLVEGITRTALVALISEGVEMLAHADPLEW